MADIIRTTLGPRSMLKMLLDPMVSQHEFDDEFHIMNLLMNLIQYNTIQHDAIRFDAKQFYKMQVKITNLTEQITIQYCMI